MYSSDRACDFRGCCGIEVVLAQEKSRIRIEHLAQRERMSAAAMQVASELACQRLVPLVPQGAVVAGYVPFRGELDVTPALRQLSGRGHSLSLPVIEAADKPLYFRRWRLDEALEVGRYGIAIPPAGGPVFKPDVLLVPLVAFDRAGHRLGYGAGYYDRTIENIRTEKQVLVIGVAYSTQEAAHIPAGVLDQRMDMVVTDKDVIRIER